MPHKLRSQYLCNAGARATPAATYTVSGSVPSLTPIQLAPVATPAMTKEAIKHLLMGKPAPKTPVETVLVPAATKTTPPVVVSGQSAK